MLKDANVNLILKGSSENTDPKMIPLNFYIGCSTSAYQIEGAWNIDGQ